MNTVNQYTQNEWAASILFPVKIVIMLPTLTSSAKSSQLLAWLKEANSKKKSCRLLKSLLFQLSHSGQACGPLLTKYFNTKQPYFLLFLFQNLLWAPVVPIVNGSNVNVAEGWVGGRKCTGNGQATNGISILEWRDAAWSCNYENWRTAAVNGKHVLWREP